MADGKKVVIGYGDDVYESGGCASGESNHLVKMVFRARGPFGCAPFLFGEQKNRNSADQEIGVPGRNGPRAKWSTRAGSGSTEGTVHSLLSAWSILTK